MQFGGNTQRQIHIQRIMIGLKWLGFSSTTLRMQHRRFNLQESHFIQQPPHHGSNLGAFAEGISNIWVDNQIHMSGTITLGHILETMKFVWERQDSLGQHFPFFCVNSQLSFVCTTNSASNTDNITAISEILDALRSTARRKPREQHVILKNKNNIRYHTLNVSPSLALSNCN